jgi:hypothetical protein
LFPRWTLVVAFLAKAPEGLTLADQLIHFQQLKAEGLTDNSIPLHPHDSGFHRLAER